MIPLIRSPRTAAELFNLPLRRGHHRVTNDGPFFVWQSPLKADRWHRYFPRGYRIVAACKIYPAHLGKDRCLSWDPVIFWSGRSRLAEELPRDWHVADMRPWDGYR